MLLQLRHIYNALYRHTKYNEKPMFQTGRQSTQYTHSTEHESKETLHQQLFEYFTHPSTFRWALPALRGKVNFFIDSEQEHQLVFSKEHNRSHIKNQTDFLKHHFQPIYNDIKFYFEADATGAQSNLQDLMGRNSLSYKGSGSAIRKELIRLFQDQEIIRQMVFTQQKIMEQYEYRACDFRKCIMGLVDKALTPSKEGCKNTKTIDAADTAMIENGLLPQLRIVLLNLLSRGSDAAALTCLLLCAALRDDAAMILLQFTGTTYDIFSLAEYTEPQQVELGDNLFLTYRKMPNYIGGYRKTDITLWARPNTMIEKITDFFGYFFYPVQIHDPHGELTRHQRYGPQADCMCNIFAYKNDYALFEWIYQPDGRYFSDSWSLGMKNQEEIILYAYIDKKGKFATPFSFEKPDLNTSNS